MLKLAWIEMELRDLNVQYMEMVKKHDKIIQQMS